MKICYIADAVSIHIIDWVQFFAKRGHEVSLITDTDNRIEGVNVINIGDCLPKIRVPGISAMLQILRKAKKIKENLKIINPHILHAHYATNYGFLAALANFHPFVLTCHGSDILVDFDKSRLESFFIRYTLRKADIVTLPSEQMKKRIIRTEINPNKIYQIQYGVNTEQFKFHKKDFKQIVAISTRALYYKYRLDVLINAIPKVLNQFNNVEFQIIGEGDEKPALIHLCKQLNIQNSIKFLGFIAHDDIPKYYKKPQIYITTSPSDGISISLLEAFASGCYPIVPDNASNRQIKNAGFNLALYEINNPVSLANSIIKVIENVSSLLEKIRKNRETTERQFSRSINMEVVNSIYEKFQR